MEGLSCRLLPFRVADGATNMAADHVLLESALNGRTSLRFYGWSEPTLSLGYFQPESIRHQDPGLALLPYVRRATGGEILIHHHEVTYALALPAGQPWQSRSMNAAAWLHRMHRLVSDALRSLSVKPTLASDAPRTASGSLCFAHPMAGDVLIGSSKIVGSAQRRRRGALLQHGAILLACSPHASSLPGIRELSGLCLSPSEVAEAIVAEFERQCRIPIFPGRWTEPEQWRIAELARHQYAHSSWNQKR